MQNPESNKIHMNRDRSYPSKMKVSSRLRIPGLSKKPPAFSSSPDLTKVGSSDSLDVDYQYLVDCHHKSYEDIRKEANHVVHPSSKTDRELIHPSCFYEWSEDFKQHVKPEETPVSEGYSRLRIFDESESKASTTSSTTSNDYSVLNIDAIEMPSNEERDVGDDNEMVRTATKNHNYFTLEVLDDNTRGDTKGVPPAGNPQDIEESEGLYFTIDKEEKVQHSSAGVYSYIELDTDENGPSIPKSGTSSASPYLTFKNASNDENVYDSIRHCTTKLQSQNHMPQDQSNVYSYIELDTSENGPSIVPRQSNSGISSGKISPSFRTTSKNNVTYDSLRNNAMKPPRSVRSISQPDQNHFYEKLWSRTPSPKSKKSRPTSLYKTSISPPLIPYHKRDQKVQSCNNNIMNGDNTYSKLKYSNTKTGLTKTHSPLTTLSADYDMVHIIQTEDGDSDSVLTDDDVSIVLSPTSPPPPENETLSNNSSHNNLVQLIITDDGPLLMPRKRSLTVDASSLRQFRNQSKYKDELRPSSAARN